jgi:hypothetical protein
MRALAGGKWEKKQQMERDAVEMFLQQGKRGSATDEVLQQFRLQDGRKSADARHDLAVVFWLAAAALMQQAEQLRLQHKGQQLQAKRQQEAAEKQLRQQQKAQQLQSKRQQQAAEKERKSAAKQQKQLEKLLRQQEQADQKRRKTAQPMAYGSPGVAVLYFPVLPAAAMAVAAAAPAAASCCAAEEKIDLTGLGPAPWQLAAAVKREAAADAVDLTEPNSPAAAGWAAAAAAAAAGAEPPGAPRKRQRPADVKPDPQCIVLDD